MQQVLNDSDETDVLTAAFSLIDEVHGGEAAPQSRETSVGDALLMSALELVDEVYHSNHDRALLRRRRFSRLQEEKLRLRQQVVDLQQRHDQLREYCGSQDVLTQLWSQVAGRQRREREQAQRNNTLLKAAASQQRELAHEIISVLQQAQAAREAILQNFQAHGDKVLRSLSSSHVPPVLAQRLDAIRASACAESTGPVIATEKFHRERTVEWSPSHDAVQIAFRVTAVYPFKLSAVAHALWKLLSEYTLGENSTQSPQELHQDSLSCRFDYVLEKPFGCMHIDGATATQRLFLADGSVLLASATASTGPMTRSDNLMTGLEMHETVQFRVVRRDTSNARSPVVLEISSHLQVRSCEAQAAPADGLSVAERLHRLEQFATRCSEEDGDRTQQELENRLLGALLNPL
jgi:hypothetical protein